MVSMLVGGAAVVGACTTNAQDRPAMHVCRPKATATLVGQAAPDDAQVRKRTGAELIRRIAPGDAVTHDFRENRVTIAVDPAGKVVQALCG
ncbi:I78 family peptidase inhibitor [Sphingomonas psychrotolerans]|nr:I78 family peptidase inhibitor [Sphingomonas psychrotolerans]